MKKPRCKICNHEPEWRDSEHFFLKFSPFAKELKKRAEKLGDSWRVNAKNFTIQLLEQGFNDRAITRDTDWGIEIPLPGFETKRIYVWFEAVCGYLSASIEYSNSINEPNKWKEFWENKKAMHYYVHGKDNIPFHTIIWPSILLGAGELHLPDVIVSSEYLTLEHKQFSKSRHWMISLPDFLAGFDAETLRYYLVVCGPENSDADFSWVDYASKVNNEMIGNFGNLVNRVLSQVKNNFPEKLNQPKKFGAEDKILLDLAESTFKSVGEAIVKAHFRDGIREIFKLVDAANKYLNDAAPWKKIKESKEDAERSLFVGTHVIKCLAILIEPYLPSSAEKIQQMLNLEKSDSTWQYPKLEDIVVNEIAPLYKRIEPEQIENEKAKLGK